MILKMSKYQYKLEFEKATLLIHLLHYLFNWVDSYGWSRYTRSEKEMIKNRVIMEKAYFTKSGCSFDMVIFVNSHDEIKSVFYNISFFDTPKNNTEKNFENLIKRKLKQYKPKFTNLENAKAV